MKNLTLLKNKLLQKKRQRGLTLIEVGLAVLISAIIIIGIMYMYTSSSNSSDSFLLTQDVTSIRAAAIAYKKTTGHTPKKLTDLTSGFVVLKSADGKGANPWHGDYSFASYSATQFRIMATGIPSGLCMRIKTDMTSTNPNSLSCRNGKLYVTYLFAD